MGGCHLMSKCAAAHLGSTGIRVPGPHPHLPIISHHASIAGHPTQLVERSPGCLFILSASP